MIDARAETGRWWPILGDATAAFVVLIGGLSLGGPWGFGLVLRLFGVDAGGGLAGRRGFVPPGVVPGQGELSGAPLFGTAVHGLPLWVPLTALGLVLVPAALMFARRRWPLASFALALAVFLAGTTLGFPFLGPGIALTIASWGLAFRFPRKLALVAVGGTALLVLVLGFASAGWESVDAGLLQVAAAVAISGALGEASASRRSYVQAVEDRAARAERSREAEAERRVSEERLRIARDLHDTVAHQISVINLQAGAAASHIGEHPERALVALGTIREAARGALGEIGALLHYLREDDAASTSPQPGFGDIDILLAQTQAAGLALNYTQEGDSRRVPSAVGAVAYRVVQEGLTNARKHGAAGEVRVRMVVGEDGVAIEITNPVGAAAGQGAVGGPPLNEASGTGFGLIGLRERVAVLHGAVENGLVKSGVVGRSRTTDGIDASYRLCVQLPFDGEAAALAAAPAPGAEA